MGVNPFGCLGGLKVESDEVGAQCFKVKGLVRAEQDEVVEMFKKMRRRVHVKKHSAVINLRT